MPAGRTRQSWAENRLKLHKKDVYNVCRSAGLKTPPEWGLSGDKKMVDGVWKASKNAKLKGSSKSAYVGMKICTDYKGARFHKNAMQRSERGVDVGLKDRALIPCGDGSGSVRRKRAMERKATHLCARVGET